MCGMIAFSFIGCSSTPNLRADKNLQNDNPMKRITLLGASHVYWPRMGSEHSVLGLKSSREGLEHVLPLVKSALEKKGYEIVFSEPVVIGFPLPNHDNVVYENYDDEGSSSKWNLEGEAPAYTYPRFEENVKLGSAALDILRDLDTAITSQQLNLYSSKLSSIKAITQEIDSDTVCAVDIWGLRYTKARAVGSFAAQFGVALLTMGMVVIPANASDIGAATLVCISGNDASVLWQKKYPLGNDPIDIEQENVDSGLAHFPDFAANLTSNCRVHESQEDMFVCD